MVPLLRKAGVLSLLTTVVSLFLASLLIVGISLFIKPESWEELHSILFVILLVASFSFTLILVRLYQRVFKPLIRLEDAVSQINQGEPDAHLPKEKTGVFDNLTTDIESISIELTDLYEDMDNRVARHTTRLAQKTASLNILYDMAASINQADDTDQLLIRFLRIFKEMVNGLAGTVRVVQMDGNMHLVGSLGLDDQILQDNSLFPLELCLCGSTLSSGDILCDRNNKYCTKSLGREMFGSDEVEVITVPLNYHEKTLGMYNIFVHKKGVSTRDDILDLLAIIGRHLGMALAKTRSDEEARIASIMEERTGLAHELHDSLAQTLASLRFQAQLLSDSLAEYHVSSAANQDLQKIKTSIDDAHIELRELLNSFRGPTTQRGLVNAIKQQMHDFIEQTGIAGFFQNTCESESFNHGYKFNQNEVMQMARIVQEALANVRKHAEPNTVRILLSLKPDGTYILLIEDDGVGFIDTSMQGQPGEHVGLTIMQERANKLGGNLSIETELGEGTRIELSYKPKD